MIDVRVVEHPQLGAAVSLAKADLVLVAGLAFVFSIAWGSFIGGASALAGLVACALAERLWADWPLRVLDTAGVPDFEKTRTSPLVTGVAP